MNINKSEDKNTESQPISTASKKTPRNISSSSSDDSNPKDQPNRDNIENRTKESRRQRFANRQEPLFRLRNPLTGRFVPKSKRRLSGPPGKKRRPNYIVEEVNPKPSTSKEDEENQDPQTAHNIPHKKDKVPRQLTGSEFSDIMLRKFASLNPRPQIWNRLGPKIVAQKVLVGSDRIVIRPKLDGEDRRVSL